MRSVDSKHLYINLVHLDLDFLDLAYSSNSPFSKLVQCSNLSYRSKRSVRRWSRFSNHKKSINWHFVLSGDWDCHCVNQREPHSASQTQVTSRIQTRPNLHFVYWPHASKCGLPWQRLWAGSVRVCVSQTKIVIENFSSWEQLFDIPVILNGTVVCS